MRFEKDIHMCTLSKILVLFFVVSIGTTFAEWIVSPGSSGFIKNIIDVATWGDLITTVQNTLMYIITFVRLVLNGIALLAMLYVGFLWVTSMGNEEKTSDGKNRIILILLGLFLIYIPDVIYRIFTGNEYYMRNGFGTKITWVWQTLYQGGTSTSIAENSVLKCNYFFCPQNFFGTGGTTSVIQFLEMAMLVVAIVMFTWGGFMMFFWSGSEETNDTAKRRLWYGVIVLLITGFIEMIYRAVFFQSNLTWVGIQINTVLVTWAKFFLYFAGPIAIIYIIIGGYYYITSGGNEERTDRGKKILMYTAFATIMLLLWYTFLIEIIGLNIF